MESTNPRDGVLRLLKGIGIIAIILINTSALAAPIPMVRILVERERKHLGIDGYDLLLSDAQKGQKLVQIKSRAHIEARCSLGGRIELVTPGGTGLKPASKTVMTHAPIHIQSLGGFIRVDGKQYRDDLYLYGFNGDCVVVNRVDLEKYVAGLLNSEMSAKWNLEALKAQAIAARTYAIYQMHEADNPRFRGLKAPFDLDSSVRDQVYEGAHKEAFRAIKAVEATRGMILTYGGDPIKAFYHSTCGGRTETPEKVWGVKMPSFRSVRCGFCERSPRYSWAYEIPLRVLEQKLRKAGKLVSEKLVRVAIRSRNLIGRVERVELVTNRGPKVMSAVELRNLVGPTNVFSTDFEIRDGVDTNIRFAGHGSGHGVGMCQWGAKTMGDQGQKYAQILKHYYPEAELQKIY